ncbi:hypothetical protein O6H91_07G111200 [Diphasiastrum complanatum]|uniref:Uncharacterized protein n=4 Tax=Diphasiastrum complanatum TaxID=34168 RepID=A0ACC2D966_DIPCM|nr:hypothetical protein O6H91_Y534800 [Diphasiastrum complanatum]KAJ7187625.1 hypothetical protein O6H91_Y534800 [Diphasiastrum complanatum]KAJ7187626.1 hypothetical protein O6H91_Y534800 [Diphasiastrum complanatum]KAJ7187627.1 hypothetical protein O6H91_Y534800 [Diphasiastrum complanatum]KAJ7187628.1 hypothetical protein O6H91_Y534800 [Diphasiastrum complanatum]
MEKGGSKLSTQDWEQIFQDFHNQQDGRNKWLAQQTGLAILEQALHIVAKKESPLKLQLLVFIEENVESFLEEEQVPAGLGTMVDTLRTVLQAPIDGVIITNTLKEQMMVTSTVFMIMTDGLRRGTRQMEALVELLLNFINRPNHSADRHLRAAACECLRELEQAYPCLLHVSAGHLLALCQSERTHAGQAYILLLTTIVQNLALHMYKVRGFQFSGSYPILSTTIPLVPFSVPAFLIPERNVVIPTRELSDSNLKEFRRVVSFLLEKPNLLTETALMEFISSLIDIVLALDMKGSLLKLQFSNLTGSYSPLLCHAVLLIYSQFPDAFEGDEMAIFKRLVLLCRQVSQPITIRLLAIHWLLGVEYMHAAKHKSSILVSLGTSLYPLIFDPLSLKASKIECLTYCAAWLDASTKEEIKDDKISQKQKAKPFEPFFEGGIPSNQRSSGDEHYDPASKLFSDGITCLSAFRWLPRESTETRLTFHVLHRFLTAGIPHSAKLPIKKTNVAADGRFRMDSALFWTLQSTLVALARRMRRLVPCVLALIDRLMVCDVHQILAERLLQTFNEDLFPQLSPDSHLHSYFPLMERIAESKDIPPAAVLELLAQYVVHKVDADKGTGGSKLWLRGTDVLSICRTVLLHHQSSRAFHLLTELLGFMCRFFPDIEVRDSARLYLRMLISIPGKKLHRILSFGDELEETAKPQFKHVSSLLRSPSPPAYQGLKQLLQLTSYIHLVRQSPLLVRQSWSLVLPEVFKFGTITPTNLAPRVEHNVKPEAEQVYIVQEPESESGVGLVSTEREALLPAIVDEPHGNLKEVRRVMDSTTAAILDILRRHFAEVPDYVNGSGIKICLQCNLRFKWQPSHKVFGEAETRDGSPQARSPIPRLADSWPAIYAVVIKFFTSGSYGPIPAVHIPFLLSERSKKPQLKPFGRSPSRVRSEEPIVILPDSPPEEKILDTASVNSKEKEDHSESDSISFEQYEEQSFSGEVVTIALEPKQPVPTLVDAQIVFSDEDGQTVQGQLESVPVGIEDLFVKPPVPSDVPDHARKDYRYQLFNALWEASHGPGKIGPETFLLKGGRQAVAIESAESVKLLEAQADRVIEAVEQSLARFVVAITGGHLVNIAKDGDTFEDTVYLDEEPLLTSRASYDDSRPFDPWSDDKHKDGILKLEYLQEHVDSGSRQEAEKGALGCFLVLIFLPPRYHLLMKMEVSDWSTLVRIRTDCWPCLAYVDEFLEALTLPRQ